MWDFELENLNITNSLHGEFVSPHNPQAHKPTRFSHPLGKVWVYGFVGF